MKSKIAVMLGGCVLSVAAHAAAFPAKPVTIVVPFTPGGAVDIVARTVAAHLSTAWSSPVIVDNRPGAGGAIGIQSVVRSTADGYTLLLGSVGPITINPSLQAKVGYDVEKELTPVVLIAKTPAVLVVLPKSPANNVAEFVDILKTNPGKSNYGSAGTGNITHLVAEYFMSTAGAAANHIPYKGSAPAITDMLGGQLDFMFDVVPTAQPYIKAGKFKALAVTSLTRSPVLPAVPTLNELGYKGFDVSSWFALYAPAQTPAAIVSQINAEVNRALGSAETQAKLATVGAETVGGSAQQLGDFARKETQRWKKVIVDRNITAN